MGMSATHCQGISECLESGHPSIICFSKQNNKLLVFYWGNDQNGLRECRKTAHTASPKRPPMSRSKRPHTGPKRLKRKQKLPKWPKTEFGEFLLILPVLVISHVQKRSLKFG